MDNDILNNMMDYLDRNSRYETIILKGDWGVGKTYLWQNKIELKIKEEDESRKIYYCSLFGLKNKEDILTSLLFNTSNIQDAETTLKDIFPGLISATKETHPVGIVGTSLIGIGKIFQKHLENIKLQNAIIVLDDIERKDRNFSINELMGLIENLKSKGNKILLMLNENELINIDHAQEIKNDWQLFKEKVIDIELTINITTEGLITILKDKESNAEFLNYEYIFNSLIKINIKNIRIAQLILNRVNKYVIKMDGAISKELTQELIKNCVICYYMYYINFNNLPPKLLLENINDYKDYAKIVHKSSKENFEVDRDYEQVYDFLYNNSFYQDDDFTNIIVSDLKNGYLLDEIDQYIEKNKDLDSKKQNDIKLQDFNNRLFFDINLTDDLIEKELNNLITKEYCDYIHLFTSWILLKKINNNNNKKCYDKLYEDALNGKININYYSSGLVMSEEIHTFIKCMIDIIDKRNNQDYFNIKNDDSLFVAIQEIRDQKNIKNNKKLLNTYSSREISNSIFKSTLEKNKMLLMFYNEIKTTTNPDYINFIKSFDYMIHDTNQSSTNSDNNLKSLKRILGLVCK